jgi:PAS domain S-box-containing protein
MVKRSSLPSTFRSLILTWPILRLVTIGLILVAIGGLWELFFSGAHILHLLSWLIAILILAIAIAIIIYVAQLAGRSEDHIAHERLRMALISGKSVGWNLDLKTGHNDWFGDLQTIFGIPSETFRIQLGEFYSYVHLEDRARVAAAVDDARDNHKPYTCEFRVVQKDGTQRRVTATGKFVYANGGKPIRMLGIAVDVTDRKEAEEALGQSEEKFSKAFRHSPVALALTSKRDHRILDVNETFERHSGWKRDEIVGLNSLDLNMWVDLRERDELLRRSMGEGPTLDLEVQYQRKDGTRGSGLASVESIQIAGEPCVLTAIVEVTDRKRAEEALRRQQHDLSEAQRLAHVGSWEWDAESGMIKWSEELHRIYGLDPAQPAPTFEELPKLYTSETWNRLLEAMESRSFPDMEMEIIRPDGTRRWIQTHFEPTRDENGGITKFRGVSQDITEEKHTRDRLRENEARINAIVNSAMDAIITVDEERRIVLFNAAAEKIFQCSANDAVGTNVERFIPSPFPLDHDTTVKSLAQATGMSNTGALEKLYALRANGDIFPIEASTSQAVAYGKKLFTVIVRDITKRLRDEEALRESERKFRRVVQHIGDAVLSHDAEGHISFANDRFLELFGFRREQLPELTFEHYIAPEFRDEIRNRHQRRLRGEAVPTHFEFEGLRSDGTRRWLEVNVVSITDHEGKIVGTQAAMRDITERKRTEQVIHDSEQRLRHLIESSSDWVYEMDRNGFYKYAGPQCRQLLGYEPEELIGKKPLDFMLRDEALQLGEVFQSLLAEPRRFSGLESTRVRKDNCLVIWETSGVPVFDKAGNFCGYRGLARDITARHRAEQALRESEERFRLLANTAPVMIWTAGTDRACDYVNKPWLDFTGRSLQQELGDGWTELIHPHDVERCFNTYVEAFNTLGSFEMQYRLRRYDGEYRWILDTGVPRFNTDGTFVGYIGSGLDITERKQAEEAIASIGRRLIEAHEQERTWIGRELHDDINQRLALLAVELEQCTHAGSGIEIAEKISHAQQRILEIARDVQSLSHRLHSSKLEYLGLVKAANSFCKELSNQYNVVVRFTHMDVPFTLSKEVSLCLFRVLQEALQNAVKHSGSDHLAVHLQGTSDWIELRVMDTGLGFEEPEAFARQGIGLISMRERLHMVHGEFFVESKPGGGTTISARVPLPLTAVKAMAG